MFLAWAAGRMMVSFTEIGKIEGRTDVVGEDGEFGFGFVGLEMYMGNTIMLFSRQNHATKSLPESSE